LRADSSALNERGPPSHPSANPAGSGMLAGFCIPQRGYAVLHHTRALPQDDARAAAMNSANLSWCERGSAGDSCWSGRQTAPVKRSRYAIGLGCIEDFISKHPCAKHRRHGDGDSKQRVFVGEPFEQQFDRARPALASFLGSIGATTKVPAPSAGASSSAMVQKCAAVSSARNTIETVFFSDEATFGLHL
jgi:hypothetical protein